ncbi:MAG: InlB B-repeat-containing protein [Candidatus Methanomethylophilaceae archaeon]|nr:InlB B-repeat-containing protein [Candidatus Methanomethylophilaceae archaeon]
MNSKILGLALLAVALVFVGCAVMESDDSDALDNGSANMTVQKGSSSTYTWAQACPSMAMKSSYDNRYFYQHNITTGVGTSSSVSDGSTVSGITVSWNSSGLTLSASSSVTARTYYLIFSDWTTEDDSFTVSFQVTAASATQYTCYLKYNANGGSGAPSDQSYTGTSTSNHTFTISSTTPSKSGYTFKGWATSSSATSAGYQPGGTISVGYKSTKTLYAVWEENVTTITITVYKGNWASFKLLGVDSSNVTSSSKTYTVNSGQSIDVDWYGSSSSTSGSESQGYITTTTYTSSCYNMVKATSLTYPGGGSDSMSAVSGGKYYPADKMTSSSSTTYYFKVSYNANGGSGAPSTTDGGTSTSSTKSVTLSSTAPTRSGYTFLGWATSSSATSATYSKGGSYSFSYGTTALYAVWQQNTYTCYLNFNANGGSGAPSNLNYTGTSTSNHTFTIPSTTPTKSGYTFLGWATSSSATSASYQPNGSIAVAYNGTTTLYAVWSQITYTCNLNFNANGGSGAPSNQTYTGTSTANHSFTIPSTIPTKSGSIFLGWATSSSAKTAAYQPGGTIAVTYNGTTTLYAVWETTVAFTSTPTAACIVLPVIIYNDDGSYVVTAG